MGDYRTGNRLEDLIGIRVVFAPIEGKSDDESLRYDALDLLSNFGEVKEKKCFVQVTMTNEGIRYSKIDFQAGHEYKQVKIDLITKDRINISEEIFRAMSTIYPIKNWKGVDILFDSWSHRLLLDATTPASLDKEDLEAIKRWCIHNHKVLGLLSCYRHNGRRWSSFFASEDDLKLVIDSDIAGEQEKQDAKDALVRIEKKKRERVEGEAKRHYSRKRRNQFAEERPDLMLALIERDGYQCKNCGNQENLTVDHIIPLSKGGSDNLDNLQILCQSCNSSKGDRHD